MQCPMTELGLAPPEGSQPTRGHEVLLEAPTGWADSLNAREIGGVLHIPNVRLKKRRRESRKEYSGEGLSMKCAQYI